jgi:transposase
MFSLLTHMDARIYSAHGWIHADAVYMLARGYLVREWLALAGVLLVAVLVTYTEVRFLTSGRHAATSPVLLSPIPSAARKTMESLIVTSLLLAGLAFTFRASWKSKRTATVLFFQRETDQFNALTCFQFLKNLRRASARSGRRVIVITDNARYHHARLHGEWRRKQVKRFALDFLPPSSPELNPIERVWKLTRRPCLHNRYFATLDGVILAVETEFANWTMKNETLRRLCADYAQLLKTLCIA